MGWGRVGKYERINCEQHCFHHSSIFNSTLNERNSIWLEIKTGLVLKVIILVFLGMFSSA